MNKLLPILLVIFFSISPDDAKSNKKPGESDRQYCKRLAQSTKSNMEYANKKNKKAIYSKQHIIDSYVEIYQDCIDNRADD